jgi:hypothetical protein
MAEKGKVYRGQEFIADVEYEVFVRSSGAFKEAQLRLNPPIGVGVERLTLRMSDGKKWNFYAVGDGDYRVTGDRYD